MAIPRMLYWLISGDVTENIKETAVRRIRTIEALEILIPWYKAGFYHIDLDYGLLAAPREQRGENDHPKIAATLVEKYTLSQKDFGNPGYLTSRDVFTIRTLLSRD
jgi:hypothetical protein